MGCPVNPPKGATVWGFNEKSLLHALTGLFAQILQDKYGVFRPIFRQIFAFFLKKFT
jgi:hypothetical protein